MNILVRDATDHDRDVLDRYMAGLQAYEQTLTVDRADAGSMAHEHMQYLLDECVAQDGFVVIAEADNVTVGFLIGMTESVEERDRHLADEYRKVGYVTDIFVEPEYRGKGIARTLLAEAESRFRRAGLSAMDIAFLSRNEGARLTYESFGFEPYECLYRKTLVSS